MIYFYKKLVVERLHTANPILEELQDKIAK